MFPLAVILCATIFAAIILLMPLMQWQDAQFPFRGVVIMPTDAELHYAARMREIYDGFWTGNTFFSEPKDQPYLQPPLPEMIPAMVSKFLHLNPVSTFVVFSVLCAFLLVVTMVGTIAVLTDTTWESLIAVCILVFSGFLLGAPWDFWEFLTGSGTFEPLRFTRPINPLWTVPWFFAAIWLTAEWLRGRRIALAYCVVPLTILVYSYVYAWSYLAVTLGLLTIYLACTGDWRKVRDLSICGAFVGVFSIPYIFHLFETIRHPLYEESSQRIGIIASRSPIFGVWMILGVLTIVIARKRWGVTWQLAAALIIGGIMAMNQQILSGRYLVPHHYHWYFFQPLASMLAMVLVLRILGRYLSDRLTPFIIGLLICVAIAFGIRYQTLAYMNVRDYWGAQQALAPVLEYVDKNMHAGQVVYSPNIGIMDFVPVYTSADVYNSSNAINYLVSTDRARAVFFFDLWVHGYTVDQAKKEFPTTLRSKLGSALSAIYFREKYGSYDAIPDDLVLKNVDAYKKYISMSDSEKIRLYPIDAVILPDNVQQTHAIALLKSMSDEVFVSEGFSVRMMKIQ